MKPNHRTWHYWVRLLFAAIALLLVLFAGTLTWFSHGQAMAYLHPARQVVSEEFLQANGIEFQDIKLLTEDHVKLSAWYTPPKNGTIILVAHGYGDKRGEVIHELFARHGYGVVAWDFRAHGESEGEFSSLGYYEVLDAKAALDFALAQPGVEHVGTWGGSMGAVTMIRAAAHYPEIEALVADSPFVTLEEEMELRVPSMPIRALIGFFAARESGVTSDQVRPVDDIASISPRPVFIIQGLADGMVPLDSAQRLYDAAGEPRQLWLENHVGHLGMYAHDELMYAERVIGFFEEYLLK